MKKTKNVVTVEEHQITGGIGSIVSEIIVDNAIRCNLLRLGFNNKFVLILF